MIALSIPSAPALYVQVLDGVFLREINEQFLTVAWAMAKILAIRHAVPVLTGAAEKRTPVEPDHASGYAWDWRSRDVKDPFDCVTEIETLLHRVDVRYYVIYDTGGTGPHFHTRFRVDAAALP